MTALAALAAVVDRFGPPEVIRVETVSVPAPGAGQVRIRVHAAGVGPRDVRLRSGRVVPRPRLPLVLGGELAGDVESLGPDVASMQVGDAVFGITGESFLGACAELAIADVSRIWRRPTMLTSIEAAAVPVVACTALEMIETAAATAGVRTLVLDAAGSVGAWLTALALGEGAGVAGLVPADQAAEARRAGLRRVFTSLPTGSGPFDVVLDPVGGELARAALRLLRPGGTLVSSVEVPEPASVGRKDVSARWVAGDVTSARLGFLSRWIDAGWVAVSLGEVMPLRDAKIAHRKIEALAPHGPGRIVLRIHE
ncbi:MAG TPA: NADP-dependent oxidoreductase [Myxococcaceae bacterium]|nr:NADP-dependent oxidoreductase [Myxococcaceae bacterium]